VNLSILSTRHGELEQHVLRPLVANPGQAVQLSGGTHILLMNALNDGSIAGGFPSTMRALIKEVLSQLHCAPTAAGIDSVRRRLPVKPIDWLRVI
jgi:hypothetical protein